jgi:glycosyltransferase involved in cell wall biosynthesis
MSPVRILHITGRFGHGGIQTWLMNMFRHIDRGRYCFEFMRHTPGAQPHDDEIRSLGGRILPSFSPRQPARYQRHVMRVLEKEGPYDVVHAHGGNAMGLVLRCAAKAGVPVRIVHSHNLQPKLGKRWRSYIYDVFTRHWLFQYATVGLGCSSAAAEALFRSRWGRDARLGVLLYGIDFAPFRPTENARQTIRRELAIPDDAPVVGHVGRFTPEKSHGFLVEVAAEVVRCVPGVRFMLVSDGPLRSEVEAKIDRLGLSDRFVLTGFRRDVPALMQAMDVFVLPSRFEGLGLVLVEAQATGLQCVISEHVPQEAVVVADHVTQIPLSAGPLAWRDAIARHLRAPRPDVEQTWMEVANSRFALKNSLADLIQVYETGRPPVQETAPRRPL